MKKGWFWICPIYYEEKSKTLFARHWVIDWLFYSTLFMHNSMLFIASILGIDIEDGYPIKITGDK